ncbi:hypothetical protein AB0M44_42320 [Streptosporangium subroseum]|uniref:hypothetical protein n=1 Tax=Streptosporangium subroseum TaxID=106412 RepID=UPI0034404CBE
MSELKRPRRAAFPEPVKPAPQEPAAGPGPAQEVHPLVFKLRFPGRGRVAVMDLSAAVCLRLVRQLAATMRSLTGVGRRIASPGTAHAYLHAIRKLDEFLAGRVQCPQEWTLRQATAEDLDDFESWLYERLPTARTAYQLLLQAVTLLREIRDVTPEAVSVALHDRLMFVGRQPRPGQSSPLDAYDAKTAEALRQACREAIRASVKRLTTEADALLAAGEDPAVGGWSRRENFAWQLDRFGPMSREALRAADMEAGKVVEHEGGVLEAHRALFPGAADLLPLFTLLILSTGLEPESAKSLRVDCLKNPTRGYVEIEYLKRRRHGTEWNRMRVRDGGAATPGGLVRLVLRLTRRARPHAPEEDREWLWIYLLTSRSAEVRASSNFTNSYNSRRLCGTYGITENGEPMTIHYRRLRKTYKAEFYRLTGGQLPLLARGHSTEVAAAHYADIPALRPVYEQAVADGLSQALEDAVRLTVLDPEREAELKADPRAAAEVLQTGEEEAVLLLEGEMDLWLSSCRDFFNSPHGVPGQACPVPFWSYLDCSNAVITSRKLPAVLAYLDHLEQQRLDMPAEAFAVAHERTRRRILTQVLPAFPDAVIAEATRPLEILPPLLGGIGSRQ